MAMTPPAFSDRVQAILALLARELGSSFQFEDLVLFIAQCRGKLIHFDEMPLPNGIVGTCIALADVDLVTTREGLDEVLRLQGQLHELSHLLLQDVPRLSFGPDTPSHEAFTTARAQFVAAIQRGMAFDSEQEVDAELLATALLDIVTAHMGSASLFSQTFFTRRR